MLELGGLTSGGMPEEEQFLASLGYEKKFALCAVPWPIFVLRLLNKLCPLASESVDYEAKVIIRFKN